MNQKQDKSTPNHAPLGKGDFAEDRSNGVEVEVIQELEHDQYLVCNRFGNNRSPRCVRASDLIPAKEYSTEIRTASEMLLDRCDPRQLAEQRDELRALCDRMDTWFGNTFWTSDDGEDWRTGEPDDDEVPTSAARLWRDIRSALTNTRPGHGER